MQHDTTLSPPHLTSDLKTVSSIQQSAPPLPPSAFAQDSPCPSLYTAAIPGAATDTGPPSPALSTTSTADGEDDSPSPILPALPAPVLSDRVREILRTPPSASSPRPNLSSAYRGNRYTNTNDGATTYASDNLDQSPRNFVTASWGSPYPESDRDHLHPQVTSDRDSDLSESSEDEPIHRLDLQTPFLRPPPELPRAFVDASTHLPSASASVLANRARRPARGLTEDWIRQHTAADPSSENYLWLSDNDGNESGTATISGHSSLRSSFSGGNAPWNLNINKKSATGETFGSTPDTSKIAKRSVSSRFLTNQSKRSSLETLRPPSHSFKQIPLTHQNRTMTADADAAHGVFGSTEKPLPPPPESPTNAGSQLTEVAASALASDSVLNEARSASIAARNASTGDAPASRVRRKIPWKGKTILFCLPRADKRGLPGNMPLSSEQIKQVYREWENLGYPASGWDLETPIIGHPIEDASQSRTDWPSPEDVARERKNIYKVTLPDLDAWAKYTADLQEAKLRALGVLTAAEVPIPATPSPAPSLMTHRRISTMQHPGQVYSPPIPTSSAGSFTFPHPFNRGGMSQSPGLNSAPTPVSINGHPAKYNARQSISIPSSHSPFQMNQSSPNWAQQSMMMQRGHHRAESPLGYSNVMSPTSPFQPTGSPAMNMHQRHQSMQYPMMSQPYQPMPSRGTPIIQEVVQEEEEEEEEEVIEPQKDDIVEPVEQEDLQQPQLQPGKNGGEAEDAEYHLEKQLMKDFEHSDYNPNNDDVGGMQQQPLTNYAPESAHTRQQSSVQFAALPTTQFASNNTVLHHPRPHSRGHSLASNFYIGDKAPDGSDDSSSLANQLRSMTQAEPQPIPTEFEESPTDQVEANVPASDFEFPKNISAHQHTFSTMSNPWQDVASTNRSSRQSSHGSKASFSKLNVEAPEFKFNPTSSFTPGSFNFGASTSSSTFEPFQGSSVAAVDMTPPSTKISAAATTFSPAQSDFSFPSFRPNAPAFVPLSQLQGQNETFTGSIFGTVSLADTVKPPKKSKAIPIVLPSDEKDQEEMSDAEDAEGRPTNHARAKRVRAFGFGQNSGDEADSQPLFAEPKETPSEIEFNKTADEDDEAFTPAVDTSTLSSGVQSEPTDTKPSSANSPSGESIGQRAANWAPFEFESKQDMVNFSAARPFGDNWTPAPVSASATPTKKPGHKKSLSVTAKVFVPGATAYHTEPEAESEVECDITLDPELEEEISEIEKYVSEADEVDATATPTPEMFPVQTLDKVTAASIPVPASISASTTARRLDTPNFPPSGLMNSRFASPPRGLKASRFASPSPTRKGADSDLGANSEAELGPETSLEDQIEEGEILEDDEVVNEIQSQESGLQAAPNDGDKEHTLTFEEIDDIMMNQMKNDPTQGVHKTISTPGWHQSKSNRLMSLAAVAGPSPYSQDFEQGSPYGSGSLSSARSKQVVQLSGESFEEDEFVDPPRSGTSFAGPIRRLNGRRHESEVPSDWDGMFAGDDERNLAPRAAFFDGRVNQIVDEVLAARLQPLERALDTIQDSLFSHGQRRSRSLSDDIQPSDADDEDDEPMPVCPVSPRKDKRMELIRSAVHEAFAQQQHTSLLGMNTEAPSKSDEMQARILDLEQRLHLEESRVHKEINDRRAAEDRAADFERNLLSVESRLANELAQRANIESRCADLETKLHREEGRVAEQVSVCHAAQDEAAEAQRLMCISTKEETRLQQLSSEQSHKIKSLEQDLNKATMRMTLLEAAQDNSQSKGADSARLSTLETELEAARRDAQMWRAEAGNKTGLAQKHEENLDEAQAEVKQLHKVLATLGTQLEENERIRENWRNKFISLQQDMTSASHQITEENARRTKHEHALLARQDVLDAKLQAEAYTRERLEKELERLECIERQGMRAISDNKRLEELLAEMRTENHKLQQAVMRHRLEFEEARESGANEVQRIRISMQNQLDEANMQVNVARVELEENIAALRSELDNVKLDADSSKARTEMMVEDANETKDRAIKELTEKYANEIEDLHTRYQHKLSLVSDEAQTREQLLLERLSLSTSKTEHLQDRIIHLEEKLDIAKQAAAAAAQQAARNSGVVTVATGLTPASSSRRGNELPEKISPQALRESIMVLQEQLQAREHRIEELEEATANLDPDMEAKITKRDDEIVWLRELLAVRHADLQDVIGALSADTFDRERVKDAAIRLKANLQMEEQERERAMNGGSAIKLPRLARTFTEAATPRVAQAVGPLAAAWGNWRKGQPAFGGTRSTPTPSVTTVSSNTVSMGKKSAAASAATTPTSVTTPEFASAPGLSPAASSSLLSGLLTPPATGSRVLSGTRIGALGDDKPQQPTAFSATGRRFTSGTHSQLTVNRTRGLSSEMKTAEIAGASTPPRELRTPPMMKAHDYDPDAQMNGFDDEDDFFED
ncbi:hypothetical protein Cpir12675_006382 [Ceratocystis pirilliformis]|uniref:Myosin class II heavy chain n=1 Tax=Ceratocystis pirilliformis TaxID=259994 RepID=A0ABR3YI68_9PEZI